MHLCSKTWHWTWYFASSFIISRMFHSLSPEKLWAALKRIFFPSADFVSSNVLLKILRISDFLSASIRIEKKLINKTPSSFKHSTATFLKLWKLNKIKSFSHGRLNLDCIYSYEIVKILILYIYFNYKICTYLFAIVKQRRRIVIAYIVFRFRLPEFNNCTFLFP